MLYNCCRCRCRLLGRTHIHASRALPGPSIILQGTLRTYARLTGPCDPPAAIGVEMSAGLQNDLPGPSEVGEGGWMRVLPLWECSAAAA